MRNCNNYLLLMGYLFASKIHNIAKHNQKKYILNESIFNQLSEKPIIEIKIMKTMVSFLDFKLLKHIKKCEEETCRKLKNQPHLFH